MTIFTGFSSTHENGKGVDDLYPAAAADDDDDDNVRGST
jgi:hypothetical protein